ncbi:MAG: putative addiction module antidote protein, partial [Marinospirillum sp.]|uniref:addiction module antidote protein n=1 Tax=Marinospirillum sp. TaxID=2183934 RepID=UPI0019DA41AA
LETDEDIQLYLEAYMEEAGDDPAFIVHALNVIARAGNMSQLARDTGLTREGLYKALSPEGNPTFATVTKVAKALGLQISLQTTYKQLSSFVTEPNTANQVAEP